MNIIKYKPTRNLLNWDFDTIFDSVFSSTTPWVQKNGTYPAVDVKEEAGSYILEADLPGLSEKDIEVKVEDNLLTISSVKTESTEEKGEGYLYKERRKQAFNRSFVLPKDVDKEQIAAAFSNGVLTLTMSKSPAAQPRQIEIKSK